MESKPATAGATMHVQMQPALSSGCVPRNKCSGCAHDERADVKYSDRCATSDNLRARTRRGSLVPEFRLTESRAEQQVQ